MEGYSPLRIIRQLGWTKLIEPMIDDTRHIRLDSTNKNEPVNLKKMEGTLEATI